MPSYFFTRRAEVLDAPVAERVVAPVAFGYAPSRTRDYVIEAGFEDELLVSPKRMTIPGM